MAATTGSAVLIGATGLVGRLLLRDLLEDARFSRVVVLGRRTVGVTHPKLTEHLIDFDRPQSFRSQVQGDVLFSALGTTLRAAGGKAAQYKVDHGYQLEVARAARAAGVPALVVISSAIASVSSPFFYSRMKGELERDVAALGFERVRLLRPGPLDGNREELRRAERWSLRLLRPLSGVLPAAMRPIPAATVARAALRFGVDPTPGVKIAEADELFRAGA